MNSESLLSLNRGIVYIYPFSIIIRKLSGTYGNSDILQKVQIKPFHDYNTPLAIIPDFKISTPHFVTSIHIFYLCFI